MKAIYPPLPGYNPPLRLESPQSSGMSVSNRTQLYRDNPFFTPTPPLTWTIAMRTVSLTNQREHWSKRAKRAKEQRRVTYMVCAPDKCLVTSLSPCDVTLTRIAPRPLDDDNLRAALKSVRDGFADAYGTTDRDPRITWRYAQEKGSYAVRIEVTT